VTTSSCVCVWRAPLLCNVGEEGEEDGGGRGQCLGDRRLAKEGTSFGNARSVWQQLVRREEVFR